MKDKVIFTGRVKPDEMNVYYRLADVSVDPVNDTLADRGRCPLKIFESWQMGVPVVTSDVGDRKILAGDPPAATLAQPGSEEDLAQKNSTGPGFQGACGKTGRYWTTAVLWIRLGCDC